MVPRLDTIMPAHELDAQSNKALNVFRESGVGAGIGLWLNV